MPKTEKRTYAAKAGKSATSSRPRTRPLGRPTKLTLELQAELVANLVDHCHRSIAAKLAGVDPATVRRWMADGRENPAGPFGFFRAAILEAESRAEHTLIRRVADSAKEDPRNAQWLLTHRYPTRWAERSEDKLEERVRAEVEKRKLAASVIQNASPTELRKYAAEVLENLKASEGKESILT